MSSSSIVFRILSISNFLRPSSTCLVEVLSTIAAFSSGWKRPDTMFTCWTRSTGCIPRYRISPEEFSTVGYCWMVRMSSILNMATL